MTLIQALETWKEEGITCLVGAASESNIDQYIENARRCDADAERFADQEWAKYHKEHADDNFAIKTDDGHNIIATWYVSGTGTRFCMATYSDYETDEEMRAAFDEWEIAKEAGEIADKMETERPGELPRAAWILIATAELQAAYKAGEIAFEREFGAGQ